MAAFAISAGVWGKLGFCCLVVRPPVTATVMINFSTSFSLLLPDLVCFANYWNDGIIGQWNIGMLK
jgi:hypothetical protein